MKIMSSVLLAGLLSVVAIPAVSDTPGFIETEHALIWGYGDIQISEYLTENFDRIFKEIAKSLEIDIQKIQNDKKILVWVVPYRKLQQLYYNQENPDPRKNIAALYDKKLNRIYLTHLYVNEYYITWGLVAYFTDTDEYSEKMISDLAKRLVLHRVGKL